MAEWWTWSKMHIKIKKQHGTAKKDTNYIFNGRFSPFSSIINKLKDSENVDDVLNNFYNS
jgi:hypothetical protein